VHDAGSTNGDEAVDTAHAGTSDHAEKHPIMIEIRKGQYISRREKTPPPVARTFLVAVNDTIAALPGTMVAGEIVPIVIEEGMTVTEKRLL